MGAAILEDRSYNSFLCPVLVPFTSVVSDTKGDAHAPVSMDAEGAPNPKAVASALRTVRAKQQNYSGRGHLEKGGHLRTGKGVVL